MTKSNTPAAQGTRLCPIISCKNNVWRAARRKWRAVGGGTRVGERRAGGAERMQRGALTDGGRESGVPAQPHVRFHSRGFATALRARSEVLFSDAEQRRAQQSRRQMQRAVFFSGIQNTAPLIRYHVLWKRGKD